MNGGPLWNPADDLGRQDRLGSWQRNLDPRLGKSHLTSRDDLTDGIRCSISNMVYCTI